MVFSSVTFLFYFLPLCLISYYLAPRQARNLVLLGFSTIFYVWGTGGFILVLIATTVVDYVLGAGIGQARRRGDDRRRKLLVTVSIVMNLSVLGYYKYAGFIVEQLDALIPGDLPTPSVLLPVGISFFTFQRMSYTVDIAVGRAEPLPKFRDLLLYILLFPQLVAGPIVRYQEIRDDLLDRHLRFDEIALGAVRFSHGLGKKVLIADSVGPVADAAFALGSDDLTTGTAWVGAIAYTVQIYFDFSGYSDMAIGLGRMLGFHFPENFDHPYSAVSITDFWRRWNITVSFWFRDYLYIPLGGSRVSRLLTYRNLMITFLATGLWHGANWTFIVWGLYHGGILLVERATDARLPGRGAAWFRRPLTLLLVIVGWVFFRAASVGQAFEFLGAMFGGTDFSIAGEVGIALAGRAEWILVASVLVPFLPRTTTAGRELVGSSSRPVAVARYAVVAMVLPLALVYVAAGTFSPFLYFQF